MRLLQSFLAALQDRVANKADIKGSLGSYKYYDNVSPKQPDCLAPVEHSSAVLLFQVSAPFLKLLFFCMLQAVICLVP